MPPTERDPLLDEAALGRRNSISPYSHFAVGAALQTADGKIYRGCNIENGTFGLTVCAERVALLSALAAGERHFTRIAVVTQSDTPATPCGPCRQLLWEFCGDIEVVLGNLDGQQRSVQLAALFPEPFEFQPED
ncbi:MAG: cytidine deaminase [Acidobacteriota bacterium]